MNWCSLCNYFYTRTGASGGDEVARVPIARNRSYVARVVRRIKYELRLTMIWVQHDVRSVADLSDRPAAMHVGQEIGTWTPEGMLSLKQVRRSFLGEEEQIEKVLERARHAAEMRR
jgi:ABC-type proline/glycine betaine transport system ATPase subunit